MKTSEPLGEGVGFDDVIVTNADNDAGGGGGGEVNVSTSFSFVNIRIFDADFERQIRILTPSRVESIDKRLILCLETTTNR